MAELHEIVLTGGPSSGKTSSLGYLSEKLGERGYRVFIVPESATLVALGGIPDIGHFAERYLPGDPAGTRTYLQIQEQIFLMQRILRKRFSELAALFPDEKRVIIYDRAETDEIAYMRKDDFQKMIAKHGLTYHDVRDSYDGVVHLVTAAIGAEEFYTKENNAARRENAEEAKDADMRTLHAWTGHPKLKIIDNSTGFEEKMKRVLAAVFNLIGVPEPLEIEKKFLLAEVPNFDKIETHYHTTEIEQTYLLSVADVEVRVRRKESDSGVHYYQTEKVLLSTGVRSERERVVSEEEYFYQLRERDPEKNAIRKTRYTFPYNATYCEVDVYHSPAGLAVLEIELTSEDDGYEIPPFLKVEREVTADPDYSNAALAALDPVL